MEQMATEKLTNAEKWKISFRTALVATLAFYLYLYLVYIIADFTTGTFSLQNIFYRFGWVIMKVFPFLLPFFVVVLIQKRLLFMTNLFLGILYLILALFLTNFPPFYSTIKNTDPFANISFQIYLVIVIPVQIIILLLVPFWHKKRFGK
jgi:hypothetical protein